MKNSILALVVCSLLVFFTADIALADWYIQFDAKASQMFRRHGVDTKWGPFATKEQCQAYLKSRCWYERHHSCCVGYDTPSSTTWSPTPTPAPRAPIINWPALEAKYFAEADQKGWTNIRIEFGPEKRYYKKENGNWVRTNAEHRTPEEQRKDQQRKGRRVKEEIIRKKLLKKRQRELEREKELFELGKSKLLKTLKGAGGEQELALKPAPIEQEKAEVEKAVPTAKIALPGDVPEWIRKTKWPKPPEKKKQEQGLLDMTMGTFVAKVVGDRHGMDEQDKEALKIYSDFAIGLISLGIVQNIQSGVKLKLQMKELEHKLTKAIISGDIKDWREVGKQYLKTGDTAIGAIPGVGTMWSISKWMVKPPPPLHPEWEE